MSKKTLKDVLVWGGGFLVIVVVALTIFVTADNRTPEQRFVDTVQSQVAGLQHEADREIISTGMALCGAIDRGATPDEVRGAFTGTGFTAREADVFTAAAKTHLCGNDG